MNTTVVSTVAQGDCAFDVMAFWQGGARDLGTWKRLRHELAAHIEEHADEECWQDAFESCGEYDAVPEDEAPEPAPPKKANALS